MRIEWVSCLRCVSMMHWSRVPPGSPVHAELGKKEVHPTHTCSIDTLSRSVLTVPIVSTTPSSLLPIRFLQVHVEGGGRGRRKGSIGIREVSIGLMGSSFVCVCKCMCMCVCVRVTNDREQVYTHQTHISAFKKPPPRKKIRGGGSSRHQREPTESIFKECG